MKLVMMCPFISQPIDEHGGMQWQYVASIVCKVGIA